MAVAVGDVVSQMRAALALSDPDLDTTIGTSVRKILDAVGEVVAESYMDRYLLDYQYDVDTKQGADLDSFVQLFGFSRFQAKRATGTVTFERQGSDTNVTISAGAQVGTADTISITVQTVVPAVLLRGDTAITVPAQAVLGGAGGNIPAASLKIRRTPLDGINTFSNQTAFTGGTDAESDDQLRLRFKRTIFRNLAGTEQMFTAVALEDNAVTQVNVIGASKRHREQIQVVGGAATSTLVGARYIYPGSSVLGTNIDAGLILSKDVAYTFNTTTPPSITSISGGVPDGIYDFEFEYVPLASRNDPTNGMTNRVDVYLNGTRVEEAVETVIWRSARVFDSSLVVPPVQSAPSVSTTGGSIAPGTYYYKITATNAAGETTPSNEVSATVPATVPTIGTLSTTTTGGSLPATTNYYYRVTAILPGGETTGSAERTIQTGSGTTNSNTLTWGAISGATGYRIYRGTSAGNESVYYAVGNVLTYTDTGAASTAGTINTPTPAPSITLNWATTTNATGYKVYRGTAAGAENTLVGATTGLTLTDTGSVNTNASPPSTNSAAASTDPLNVANFLRNDATPPVAGNNFVALSFAPATQASVTGQIVIGATTYIEGTDFWLVNDITREGGTSRSLSGLEFKSAANGQTLPLPADGTTFATDYNFNAVPRDVEAAVGAWRLVTTDVRVHQAKPVRLNINLAVILNPGQSLAAITPLMTAALGNYISTVGFGGVVQVSDIIEVAHQVAGVDAVRVMTSVDDPVHYAIQQVSGTGTLLSTYASGGRATDVIISDDSVPVLNSVNLVQRAQNTFGVV